MPRTSKSGRVHLFTYISIFAVFTLLPVRWETRARAFFQNVNRSEEIALRQNNLGIAYMDQQRPADALKAFDQAAAVDPSQYISRLNQGIALLNLQRTDDARKILTEICARHPLDPYAWYNLGLLEKSVGNIDQALGAFEHVNKIDPGDADTHYFLGSVSAELQQYPKAIAEFTLALKLNPYHLSAEFGLAQAYRRTGDISAAQTHLARFQHLNSEKLGAPMALVYGEQGKFSLAERISSNTQLASPALPVHFRDVTAEAGLLPAGAETSTGPASKAPADDSANSYGSGACIFDFDGSGHPSIFLADADGQGHAALYHNDGRGHFTDVTRQTSLAMQNAVACAAGDYDNDGRTDLAVSFKSGAVALYHNEANHTFTNVTERAGIRSTGALALTFLDYDHDGDLDLYVTRPANPARPGSPSNPAPENSPPDSGNQLWRNNGNGTFTEWTTATGLQAYPGGISALATDTNNDRAIDLIVAGPFPAPLVFLNPREGKFTADPRHFSGIVPPHAVSLASLDFDKDGWMDIAVTNAAAPGLALWRNANGTQFERFPLADLNWSRGWGVAALDYDNDGWIDIVATGEDAAGHGKIALLRNQGPRGFRDVTTETGLDKIAAANLENPRAILPFDATGDGAEDLLITRAGAPPLLLKNEGGAKNHWIDLSFKGTNDDKSALGAKVEILSGAYQQKFELNGSSYLGQSVAGLHVGLGAETEAEVVRMLWPTGVLQDEVHLAANAPHNVVEIDRRGSSCPIVFVWNGKKFEFLADMIGPGIVGHWIGPGANLSADHPQRNTPDPDEYFKVEASQVAPRSNGFIEFRLLEPMEELDYLDQARLLAVDHPPTEEVYPNERFMSKPPFPEFKVIAATHPHAPVAAWGATGEDVLPLLANRDRKYLSDFTLAPYAGFATPHTLTLDLGDWDPQNPLRLLMDGFTDYFSATSMYAAWQAGIAPQPPSVEVQLSDGQWKKVIDEMGIPAGLARTMVADLTGKLPPGARRIRLTTNLAIYWDRIRIDNSPAATPGVSYDLHEIPLASAQLEFRGYPQVVEGNPNKGTPVNDLRYIYENISLTGPYSRQQGNYTRYGDVKSLVETRDNKYVIYGSGDEIVLDFDPSPLPPLKPGWTRDYFIYADGFAKDMDFYAAHGDTVAPLPFHTLIRYPYPPHITYPADADHLRYQLDYNTRPVNGPLTQDFQFHYSK